MRQRAPESKARTARHGQDGPAGRRNNTAGKNNRRWPASLACGTRGAWVHRAPWRRRGGGADPLHRTKVTGPARFWFRIAIGLLACLSISPTLFADQRRPISFRYDVLAAISKQGCSSGECHGSPSGKGGFRLSLRGFDPQLDRRTLTREYFGRRINPLRPDKSLLLLKPTMQLAHGGGRRLRKADPAYAILHDWIARGCPDDRPDVPVCEKIEITPAAVELNWPQDKQLLRVRAYFDDGTSRDVTHLTRLTSSHPQVASVDAEGAARFGRRGEVTVMARYLDHIATAELQMLRPVDGLVWPEPPAHNAIDRLAFARLKKLQIQPSPLSSDSVFLRRIHFDLLGQPPSATEIEAFLRDDRPDKRSRLVDRLLERPEHAEYWAQHWGDLLRVKRSKLGEAGVRRFHRWLVGAVRENLPLDQFAEALLTASGGTKINPAANFYRATTDANDCAEAVSQLFLGIRIQCAKCHNHPFDRWSQDHYYGIGAFFSRVRRKQVAGEMVIWTDRSGEVVQPNTGRQMKPWLPLAGSVDPAADIDRRQALADWLTAPDNPFFAQVIVNRTWGYLFGKGLVDPVDDFRADNPPAHPDVLARLARDFVADGFDQRELIRTIAGSRLYQLSSKTTQYNADDNRYFSHAHARLLRAEQLLNAVCHATGVAEDFGGLPAGTTATALPSPDFGIDFLRVFGQPSRNTVCECERGDEPRLAQALQLINGPLVAEKLRRREGRVQRLIQQAGLRRSAAGDPPQSGLIAWFRADGDLLASGGNRAQAGESVYHWPNELSRESGVSQESSAQRPSLVAGALGGMPAVRFDGKDDYLHNLHQRLLPAGAPRTVMIVGQLHDDTGGALFTFGRERQGGSSVFTAQHVMVAGSYYVYSDGVNGQGNTTAPPEAFQRLREPFVTTFVSRGAGEKLQVRLNGGEMQTQQAGGVGPDQGTAGFTIGSREDIPPGQQVVGGDICEILVYDRALGEAELQAAGAYLATRYDLQTAYRRVKSEPGAGVQAAAVERLVRQLYLATFCRDPSADELQTAVDYVIASEGPRAACEDVAWALLNSKEFLFQH